MDLEIEPSKILYSIGAFLAAVSIIYLISSQVDLSPLTKSFMLLVSFTGLYFTGQTIEDSEIGLVTFVLSGIAAVSFVLYTIFSFDLSSSVVLLGLAISAAVFMIAGYNLERLRSFEWPISSSQAVLIVGTLGVVFLGIDIASADPQYSYDWEESVNISGEEVRVGEVTVENSFYLPRNVDSPHIDACLYTPERENVYLSTESHEGLMWKGTETLDVTVRAISHRENGSVNGTFAVEVTENDCPTEMEEPKLLIKEEDLTTP